ncbi:MAG: nitroreductase [Desulfobacterales bacterium]|nr:nitroreductase [Desulfobacterales bacterium]
MDRNVTTVIDPALCTGCGDCIRVCPKETISLQAKKAVITGTESLACGHCAAICPTGAVTVKALLKEALALETVVTDDRWLPYGEFDTGQLFRLMRSRRACRNYLDTPVPLGHLQDLVKIGISAPSGSNCQQWTFTLLPSPSAVLSLGRTVGEFFRKLNKTAGKAWLRTLLALFGRLELQRYHRDYHADIEEKLREFDTAGKDFLFWHAPAVIIIGTTPGASCPKEDALMATQNILLGAHSMGLGTCPIGFAVAAMNRDRSIQVKMGMAADEIVHAVVAVGYPDEKWRGLADRKKVIPRVFHG